MFRTQSKEVCESGTYQTVGMDVVATAERVILIDTQVSSVGMRQSGNDGVCV